MKISFRMKSARPTSRQDAWACCTANFVLPGFGSLMGGRKAGYAQAALCLVGFFFTMTFGVKFVLWGIQHWSELREPSGTPEEALLNVWHQSRFALLGILAFAIAWLWALCSSLAILSAARRAEAASGPA